MRAVTNGNLNERRTRDVSGIDGKAVIHVGHNIDSLRAMPAQSVHCVVTSPPYWGLRAYGTDPQVWGGEPSCSHEFDDLGIRHMGGPQGAGGDRAGRDVSGQNSARRIAMGESCGRCGAWRGELGSEPTPQMFVAHLVEVFAEVHRVLRDDGTCWINLGDSYSGSGKGGGGSFQRDGMCHSAGTVKRTPLPPKNLIGIPWRVALAIQDWGWILRSDIIWHKPNPMPFSVTDRPSTSHEYLFLMVKKPRYFYDHVAVREIASAKTLSVNTTPTKGAGVESAGEKLNRWMEANGGRYHPETRNLRTVWKIASQPYREAHYATFPPRLVEPCIKAGTSERGCCPHCGAPWRRLIQRQRVPNRPGNNSKVYADPVGSPCERHNGTIVGNRDPQRHITRIVTTGWQPTCKCPEHEPVPCVVLDPFGGSGATAVMAEHLERRWVLCELNAEYAAMADRRIAAGYRPSKSKACRKKSHRVDVARRLFPVGD